MTNESSDNVPWNPYGPASVAAPLPNSGSIELPPGTSRGLLSHVPVVGILMVVQGVLDLVAGIAASFYAFMIPVIFTDLQSQAAAQGNHVQPMPPEMGLFMALGLGAFSIALLTIGGLTIYSGVCLVRFRSRALGIGMLCAGMVTLFTCYCFPTSVALAVYGFIVLLNPPVRLAFDLRLQGHTASDIERAFALAP